jgi:hypothetical protein
MTLRKYKKIVFIFASPKTDLMRRILLPGLQIKKIPAPGDAGINNFNDTRHYR